MPLVLVCYCSQSLANCKTCCIIFSAMRVPVSNIRLWGLRGCNFQELLPNKLRFTWGWAEVCLTHASACVADVSIAKISFTAFVRHTIGLPGGWGKELLRPLEGCRDAITWLKLVLFGAISPGSQWAFQDHRRSWQGRSIPCPKSPWTFLTFDGMGKSTTAPTCTKRGSMLVAERRLYRNWMLAALNMHF